MKSFRKLFLTAIMSSTFLISVSSIAQVNNNYVNTGTQNNYNLNNIEPSFTIINNGQFMGVTTLLNPLNSTTNAINFKNNPTGEFTGNLVVKNGIFTFDNNGQGKLHDFQLNNVNAQSSINNSGLIYGSNSIGLSSSSANMSSVKFNNNVGGNLSGSLKIYDGVEKIINAGTMENFTMNTDQRFTTVENTGSLIGNNKFVKAGIRIDEVVTFNNSGSITGGITSQRGRFNFTNTSNNLVQNMQYLSIDSVDFFSNEGVLVGDTNSFNTQGSGEISLSNTSSGDLSGRFTFKNGFIRLANQGKMHDMVINNEQNLLTVYNYGYNDATDTGGRFYGNNVINNLAGKTTTINNDSGKISGILTSNNGNLNIKNGKIIDGLNYTSNNSVASITNNKTMKGDNSITANNGGTVKLANTSTGDLSGTLNVNSGLTDFSNEGLLHDLNINNSMSNLTLKNTGTINGTNNIKNAASDKSMTINNLDTGKISDNLNLNSGKLVVNNTGTISNLTAVADASSQMTINNTKLEASGVATGNINGNNTFEGKNNSTIVVNNRVDGNITGIFNIKNGTTLNNEGAITALTINNQQDIFNLNNTGAGSLNGVNTFNNYNDSKVINLTNQSTDSLTGGLVLKDGILNLNNISGSSIDGYSLTANSATLNLNNSAMITGHNILESVQNGVFNLANKIGGTLKGILDVKGGLQTFSNAGLINGLELNNSQPSLTLANSGTISGTNAFNNTTANNIININNSATTADVSGTMSSKLGTLNLANNSGTIHDLNYTSDNSTTSIANFDKMKGVNSINAIGNGSVKLANESTGDLSGTLNANSGLTDFSNAGTIHDLSINNGQAALTLMNNGVLLGNNSFTNSSANNHITINNEANNGIQGTLSSHNGHFNLNNSGVVLNGLNYTNDGAIAIIANAGQFGGTHNLNNTSGTLQFNNNGLLSGMGTWSNVALNNLNDKGIIKDLELTSKDGSIAIVNDSVFNGNNILNASNGTYSFENAQRGVLSEKLTVNGGLDFINNHGSIQNLDLQANQDDFTINNLSGHITGNNILGGNNNFAIVNSGTGEISNNNFLLNAPNVTLTQTSSRDFTTNLLSTVAHNNLTINNSTLFNGTLAGDIATLELNNNNTSTTQKTLEFTNTGTINTALNLNNHGYTTVNNSGNLQGITSDANTPSVDCPSNIVELNNSSNISGDISVMNNILKFNNSLTGNVTSNHIDSKDIRLTNRGAFDSDTGYLFSVQNHLDVENSGSIYGREMAFKLTGSKVFGTINNTGLIYSQGTTIGYADPTIPCLECNVGDDLIINNTGKIVAVDVNNLTIPNLNSKAINAFNATVNNQSTGLIAGSLNLKDYNQAAGSTWVAFLDKDLTQMSTIAVKNKVNIADGSIMLIHTNNDVKAFENGQTFDFVTAGNMNNTEIEEQIKNYTIQTDSPFANYKMVSYNAKGLDTGAIQFNHVAPDKFADATDIATASHNNIVLGSHRMYELFVNRDINQVQGMSSGDSFTTSNKLNFMPIGGYAHQGDKDGHSGYDSSYYGGLGYFEHDFNNNLKGGLGFAYMNNNTDFNDAHSSNGKIDSYRPFAYINYELNNWRIDLAGGVAQHKIDNTRKYSFNNIVHTAKGKYDADEISGHLNVGYKFNLEDKFSIQPIAGLYAANISTDFHRETGDGPMNMFVKSEDYNSLKSMLGIKFKKDYEYTNHTSFTPELHLRWYHELGDTQGGVNAYFLAQEQLFNTSGIESPKDIGDIALRFTTKSGSKYDLFSEVYYQFGDDFYNAGGTIGLQYNF